MSGYIFDLLINKIVPISDVSLEKVNSDFVLDFWQISSPFYSSFLLVKFVFVLRFNKLYMFYLFFKKNV